MGFWDTLGEISIALHNVATFNPDYERIASLFLRKLVLDIPVSSKRQKITRRFNVFDCLNSSCVRRLCSKICYITTTTMSFTLFRIACALQLFRGQLTSCELSKCGILESLVRNCVIIPIPMTAGKVPKPNANMVKLLLSMSPVVVANISAV